MKQYSQRTIGLSGTHDSLTRNLNEVEKMLVTSQEVVEIRGKVRHSGIFSLPALEMLNLLH
jgi:hypothetical protein